MEKMSKAMWKTSPPGVEQEFLNKLFEDNKIDPNSKPAEVYHSNEIFKKFSLDTFRAHFNRTKRRYSLSMKREIEDSPSCSTSDDYFEDIKEISGTGNLGRKLPMKDQSNVPNAYYNYVKHDNGPIMRYVVHDPDEKTDKVVVVIPLFAGTDDVRFELNSTGTSGVVSFEWPKLTYSPTELFRRLSKNPFFPSYHPKVVGLETELKHFRQKIDEIPRAAITISLPKPVQTDKSKIQRFGVNGINGEKIVLIELWAIPNDYENSIDESLVSFN